MKEDKKKIFIRTFGCQMNLRDSEFVMGLLLENGFAQARSMAETNVILFNSCSVRKHAVDRLFSNISDLRGARKKNPNLIIALMGCAAQEYKERILERLPMVDLACGPGNEHELPVLLKEVIRNRCPIIAADKVNDKRPEKIPGYREGAFKAYVSISEGCGNFCSYCIVPYVRGRERSRNTSSIIKEVKDLAGRGFKEITLLGQNVNSYGNDKGGGFIRLLEKLNKIDGIARIRFMTSHPKDASPDLFRAMRDLDKVCEHLHLPFQSGSDRILKLMNRRYKGAAYLKLAEAYRDVVPGGSITTDVIVGFPSETKKDFNDTVRLVKSIGFDSSFIFKYSPRPPARAARLKDSVPGDVKQHRLETLLELQRAISEERNRAMIGAKLEVLGDGRSDRDAALITGRTRTNRIAVFGGGPECVGKLVDITVESATPYALKGRRLRKC